jgi:restriction system protein
MSTARYSRRYGYNDNYWGPSSPPLTFDRFVRGAARAMRQVERANRAAEAAASRAEREVQCRQRDAERAARRAVADEKSRRLEEARQYAENRSNEASASTEEINERVAAIRSVLADTLLIDDAIEFDSLRTLSRFPDYRVPDWPAPKKPLISTYLAQAGRPLPLLGRLPYFARRYDDRVKAARRGFSDDNEEYKRDCAEHEARLAKHKSMYESALSEHRALCEAHISKVDDFEARYRAGDQSAVTLYCGMVFERSEYNEALEPEFDVAFEAPMATVLIRVKASSVVPSYREFTYVKSRDEIKAKPRPGSEIRSLYRHYVSSACVRSIHELLEADRLALIKDVRVICTSVELNPATGKEEECQLLQLTTDKDTFLSIDLAKVDPHQCAMHLNAVAHESFLQK